MQPILNRPRIILLVIAGWLLYGLFFAGQSYLSNSYAGRHVSFRQTLLAWLGCSVIWIFFTPVVYKLARDFPFEKGKLRVTIPVHLAAATLVSLVALGAYTFLWLMMNNRAVAEFTLLPWVNLIVAEFHFNILLYFILIGSYYVYNYYQRFRKQEQRAMQLQIETAQLGTQLAKAQLDALKMQIHPHFLFNTLNSISVLMREDATAANHMLVRLSELLRVAMRSKATQVVPLQEELDFLRDYLAIEQTRFQDRLTVTFDVEDAALESTVPNLILQPLVENAIRHGVGPKAEAGMIQIAARRTNGFVELSVRDNGSGFSSTPGVSNGIGLKNTQERLEKLYGDNHEFEIVTPEDGGLRVNIRIPLRNNE